MSKINSYLWVQNKNYDGKTIVLKNDESVSSSEVIEKFKSYYFEKGSILNEIKGFKLTLYRKLIGGTSALVLDGHLLEKDHEGRYVPFSYLLECDNHMENVKECIGSFPSMMKKSLEIVQKQVDNEKIKELFENVDLNRIRNNFKVVTGIAAVFATAAASACFALKKKNSLIGILLALAVMIAVVVVNMKTSNK